MDARIFILIIFNYLFDMSSCVISCPYVLNKTAMTTGFAQCIEKCCQNDKAPSLKEACCSDNSPPLGIILGYSIPMGILTIGLIICLGYCICLLYKPPVSPSDVNNDRSNSRLSTFSSFFRQRTRTVFPEEAKDYPPSYDEVERNQQDNRTNTFSTQVVMISIEAEAPPPYNPGNTT